MSWIMHSLPYDVMRRVVEALLIPDLLNSNTATAKCSQQLAEMLTTRVY
jgi:hypothetical protein